MISVTRLYRFSASHRLNIASLTEQQNSDLYGKCNNPYGHGHDYVLEVTCSGAPDPVSGLMLPIAALDRFVETQVLRHFAFRNINEDVPEFAELVPTTENLALVIARMLHQNWSEIGRPDVHLSRIHIQETARNGFDVLVPQPSELPASSETGNIAYA